MTSPPQNKIYYGQAGKCKAWEFCSSKLKISLLHVPQYLTNGQVTKKWLRAEFARAAQNSVCLVNHPLVGGPKERKSHEGVGKKERHLNILLNKRSWVKGNIR